MRKVLKQDRGSTLIELITVLVISTLLIMSSAAAISTFYRRYKVISEFGNLQKRAMEALMYIRNGYPMDKGKQFYGIANAKSCQIVGSSEQWGSGSGIKIIPPRKNDLQRNDWITFYRDGKFIKVDYMYNGVEIDTPKYLFPPRNLQDKMEVTKFVVTDANALSQIYQATVNTKNSLFKIQLEARVRVRDGDTPSKDEYKTISYTTYMVKKKQGSE